MPQFIPTNGSLHTSKSYGCLNGCSAHTYTLADRHTHTHGVRTNTNKHTKSRAKGKGISCLFRLGKSPAFFPAMRQTIRCKWNLHEV